MNLLLLVALSIAVKGVSFTPTEWREKQGS